MFHPRKLVRIAPLAVALNVALVSSAASASCIATPADKSQVVEAMRTMYAAAASDDLAKFHTVAASDFYAFDGGKRYDGDALMELAKQFHAAGDVIVWNCFASSMSASPS